MTPSKSTEKQQHGHYTLHRALRTVSNQDGWLESLGDVGEALKEWQAAIIADIGGPEAISAMEYSWWGWRGLNPHGAFAPQDFKSCAYANFATSPRLFGWQRVGIIPRRRGEPQA